jgi:hypothetical protein
MTGAAIIAYGLIAFSLGVKYLRVVDHTLIEAEHEKVKVESIEHVVLSISSFPVRRRRSIR